MYSLYTYGRMIADGVRMDAYAAALRHAINSDSVVLDIGSGQGVFALLACRLGARRVYAVEPASVITIAREAAAANGFADRIEFFENTSTEITLDEPADVIISDLRGVLPWFQQHIPSIMDARARLLRPGGLLIPRRDVLWAAVIEAHEQYKELVDPWQKNRFDFDLSAATRLVTNIWGKARIKPEQLLVEPMSWTGIDYYEVDCTDTCAEISWRADRKGTAHGLAVWFDSELIDGVGFSNHPAAPEMIYGNGFFPFSEPVELMKGDLIKLRLEARMVQADYIWRWDTEFFTDDRTSPKASFKQSTFYGALFSPAQLRKSAL